MSNFVRTVSLHSPRQEGHHESKPRKREDTSIFVDRVENGNRTSFPINRVYLWGLPESSKLESHGW